MRRAAVAVIGGGVMGASAAYHLAARGWRDVVILDRGAGPGEGSTGRATGGYRAQYATAVNVRLSLLAREKLCRFEAETGVDPGYVTAGYLWLAADGTELAELEQGRQVQQAAGLHEAVAVGPDEVARINPALAPDGIAGGVYLSHRRIHPPAPDLEGVPGGRRAAGRSSRMGCVGHRPGPRPGRKAIADGPDVSRADRRRGGGQCGRRLGWRGGGVGRRGTCRWLRFDARSPRPCRATCCPRRCR